MAKSSAIRNIGAVWGVGGVVALLGFAIWRLTPHALELAETQLSLLQIIALVAWCVFMIYTEGYQTFGRRFAPRIVARAQYIARGATWPMIVFAPLYCIGYFGATKKRMITSYVIIVLIAAMVIAVSFVPQPWRGIIDTGVVLGLLVGIGYLFLYALYAVRTHEFVANPESE